MINIKNMLRKNIYKWHRKISLIVALPVVLWALSGFMHPIMTTIRPGVATQFLQTSVIDSTRIKTSLQEALMKNHLSQFHNFRFVHIDTNWFYQVQLAAGDIPVYLSAQTGNQLRNGDKLYAQYIAKQFLEGQRKPEPEKKLLASLVTERQLASAVGSDPVPVETVSSHDCCDAATTCVLGNEEGSQVDSVELIHSFNAEYKFVNRLLPVYKVSFDRPDGIRIYVETTSDRFAYAVDNNRATFDRIFSLFHNWSWLDAIGKGKYIIMALLLAGAFLSTLMGIYIFIITTTKKANGNDVLKARRNHRWTSILVSLFTLMFSFSGAFHALEKLQTDNRYEFYTKQQVSSKAVALDLPELQKVVQKPVANISLVSMNNEMYWQVVTKSEGKNTERAGPQGKDMMKDKKMPRPNAVYVNVNSNSPLNDGEKKYAHYLAGLFSGNSEQDIQTTEVITKFEGEYGFVNKRLPVWKIGYASDNNERYYVETSTGKLAVRVDDNDLYEGYSFALLHKHHFMDFSGKTGRDISTMFWALAQVAMVAVGLILWRKSVKKKMTRT